MKIYTDVHKFEYYQNPPLFRTHLTQDCSTTSTTSRSISSIHWSRIRSPPASRRLLQKIAINNHNFGAFKRLSIEGFQCEHHKTCWTTALHRGVSAVKISSTSFNPKSAGSDFRWRPRAAAGPRILNVNYRRTAAQIVIKIKIQLPPVLDFIQIGTSQRHQQRFYSASLNHCRQQPTAKDIDFEPVVRPWHIIKDVDASCINVLSSTPF